jgi:hypothetical protein
MKLIIVREKLNKFEDDGFQEEVINVSHHPLVVDDAGVTNQPGYAHTLWCIFKSDYRDEDGEKEFMPHWHRFIRVLGLKSREGAWFEVTPYFSDYKKTPGAVDAQHLCVSAMKECFDTFDIPQWVTVKRLTEPELLP